MKPIKIFLSVGRAANAEQEAFICAVEGRLRGEGLTPCTVGRNAFSSDPPLKAIRDILKNCSGAFILALERSYFPAGMNRRGGHGEEAVTGVRLPTPWLQIEAALAYANDLPLFAMVEAGLKMEGLLEPGNAWPVQCVELRTAVLSTPEFNRHLTNWRLRVASCAARSAVLPGEKLKRSSIEEMHRAVSDFSPLQS